MRGLGSRVANANWNPDNRQLNANANDPDNASDDLGARPSRSLKNYRDFKYLIHPPSIRPISCNDSSALR